MMTLEQYQEREAYLERKQAAADAYWERRAKVDRMLIIGLPILAACIAGLGVWVRFYL